MAACHRGTEKALSPVVIASVPMGETAAMRTAETIPEALLAPAEAALTWINQERRQRFELTGLVDVEDVNVAEPFEMGLVLCDGERCAREQVRVVPKGEAYDFELVQQAAAEIPPLLDPPVGIRSHWLQSQLEKHEFVLLLFYRGLW